MSVLGGPTTNRKLRQWQVHGILSLFGAKILLHGGQKISGFIWCGKIARNFSNSKLHFAAVKDFQELFVCMQSDLFQLDKNSESSH